MILKDKRETDEVHGEKRKEFENTIQKLESAHLLMTPRERVFSKKFLQTDDVDELEAAYTPKRAHFGIYRSGDEVAKVKIRDGEELPPELANLNPNESFFANHIRGAMSEKSRSNSEFLVKSDVIQPPVTGVGHTDAMPIGSVNSKGSNLGHYEDSSHLVQPLLKPPAEKDEDVTEKKKGWCLCC